jgi:hypothetical protein
MDYYLMTMNRCFVDADVARLTPQLTLDEATASLGAPSWQDVNKIKKHVPGICMDDGPSE